MCCCLTFVTLVNICISPIWTYYNTYKKYAYGLTDRCKLKKKTLFAQFSCFFQLFSVKKSKKANFNQHLECATPNRLSKYTTNQLWSVVYNIVKEGKTNLKIFAQLERQGFQFSKHTLQILFFKCIIQKHNSQNNLKVNCLPFIIGI